MRSRLPQQPAQRLSGDVGGDGVAAVELLVLHIEVGAAQGRDGKAAAAGNRQHGVTVAMRDEDARRADAGSRRDETRRVRDDVAEEVAIGQAERERVRGA